MQLCWRPRAAAKLAPRKWLEDLLPNRYPYVPEFRQAMALEAKNHDACAASLDFCCSK